MELGRVTVEELGMLWISLNDAAVGNTVASTYGQEYIAYGNALKQVLEKFAKLD